MSPLKSSTFWKVFFYVWLAYSAYVLFLTTEGAVVTVGNILFLVLLAVGAVAIYGLGHRRALGPRLAWRIFFVLELLIHAVPFVGIVAMMAQAGWRETLSHLLGEQPTYVFALFPLFLAIVLLYLYGLYRYAFRSRDIWKDHG